MNIRGKKVLIVGFGRSGQAAARYCLEKGAIVTVTDKDKVVAELALLNFGKASFATTHFGSHPPHIFSEADIIVVSPGVPLTLEGIKIARKRGLPVIGEMELVLDEITAPIIAITGTNGKSTVTTLIGEMLKEAGIPVLVGGNLGTPLIDLLRTTLHASRFTQYIVLEISSYQLEITPSLHPYISVLLNITEDHLDRYGSFDEYIAAKALITKNLTRSDYIVFNEDDPIVKKIVEKTSAQKVGFSARNVVAELALPNSGKASFATTGLVDLTKAKITGIHNKENIIAASLAAKIASCKTDHIQRVIEGFKGLPHRNQFVREVKGIRFYDDSKATNVGATVKSLEGFDSKVVLIAGGLDKGGSYEPLRELVREKVKALVLIGAAKEKIAAELGKFSRVVMAGTMAEAVSKAYEIATKGDVVLLAPACASFDMFKDYAQRGDVFAEEVEKI